MKEGKWLVEFTSFLDPSNVAARVSANLSIPSAAFLTLMSTTDNIFVVNARKI